MTEFCLSFIVIALAMGLMSIGRFLAGKGISACSGSVDCAWGRSSQCSGCSRDHGVVEAGTPEGVTVK